VTAASEEKLETCTLCGRLFLPGKLVWSDRLQAFVCPDCLVEEESCGCGDD